MSRNDDLTRVLSKGLVAILRSTSSDQLVDTAAALADGGIDIVEVTFTVPNALEIISALKKKLGSRMLVGAGTVLDPETARAAILAGAEFIVSPTVNTAVIDLCHRYDKLVFPGAFTPTEILTAWEAGADVVKVFPADGVGPAYLKALKGPFPQIRMMPTGGVNLNTMADFLAAGACAVGLGSSLAPAASIAAGDFAAIRRNAVEFVNSWSKLQSKR
jgi:2-dehydro-3-deoxyphosphogluconate aldolase/(4S)-4-hydroxy-2-oxoglutarate aldolase